MYPQLFALLLTTVEPAAAPTSPALTPIPTMEDLYDSIKGLKAEERDELHATVKPDDALGQARACAAFLARTSPDSKTIALEHCRLGAVAGDARAQYLYSSMLDKGIATDVNLEEATKWLKAASDQRLVVAMSDLGAAYHAGRGVEKDDVKAFGLYRLAAEAGNLGACINLGLMYRNGEGTEKDLVQAEKWFRIAADKGASYAQRLLGRLLYMQDRHAEARPYLGRAASFGNPEAQHLLGMVLLENKGVKPDLAKGRTLLEDSARQAWLPGMHDLALALCCRTPAILPPDEASSRAWWILAKEKGDTSADKYMKELESRMRPDQVKKSEVLLKSLRAEMERIQKIKSGQDAEDKPAGKR